MSVCLSTGFPRACSGLMYEAVPRMAPKAVPLVNVVGECESPPPEVGSRFRFGDLG